MAAGTRSAELRPPSFLEVLPDNGRDRVLEASRRRVYERGELVVSQVRRPAPCSWSRAAPWPLG